MNDILENYILNNLDNGQWFSFSYDLAKKHKHYKKPLH